MQRIYHLRCFAQPLNSPNRKPRVLNFKSVPRIKFCIFPTSVPRMFPAGDPCRSRRYAARMRELTWSIERLKMELQDLEREYDSVARDLREMEEYCSTRPRNEELGGLTILPKRMDSIKEQMKTIKLVLREKL